MKKAAVKIDGRQVTLEVFYSIPNIDSDCNRFSEIIGGRFDITESEAISMVVESATVWAKNLRLEFPELSVWDSEGNSF